MSNIRAIEFQVTSSFTFVPVIKRMGVEASDLGLKPGQLPFSNLYTDALDVGCVLVNPVRNTKCRWYLNHTEVNEGDVRYWEFKPTSEEIYKNPQIEGWIFTIYND